MRFDTPEFREKNKSRHQKPIYVINLSFDDANLDTHFLTTHTVNGLTGSISNKSVKVISSRSQKLSPDEAHSTIGGISFKALDIGLSDKIRTKLNEGKGLKGKRVQVYKGHRGLLWSQYTLLSTFIVGDSVSYLNKAYTFKCADIQRSTRQKIFVVEETKLLTSLSAEATEIEVFDASKFQTVYQVPSATGLTLLRSLQVERYASDYEDQSLAGELKHPSLANVDEMGIIKIENDDGYELAIWTEKEGNTLKNLIRGVLSTKAIDVVINAGETSQNAPSIKEYVYLNMPALKALYALYTGSLYGHPGKFLPDHWHLGISTDYIKTSTFVNIGSDLWDLSNDDLGFPVLIKGKEDQNAKELIEKKILYMLGLYTPINNFGEITLKRIKFVGATGSYSRLLNRDNVYKYGALVHDQKSVLNALVIRWNYDEKRELYTRTEVRFDTASISTHGKSKVKVVELDTLQGSRHSTNSIQYHFNTIQSRYASPPLRITITGTPDQDDIEVGDIVRVDLTEFEDYTSEAGGLNRNFEVQQVKIDKRSGRPILTLFGSSERASDIPPEDPVTVDDSFIISEGTEINAVNFGSAVSSVNGITTITGNITLTGGLGLSDTASIFYCAEDLTINASAIVTVNNNVQLRAAGFLQHNGKIDGKGRGHAGGVPDSIVSHILNPIASNLGTQGVGNTYAQGGFGRRDIPRPSHYDDGFWWFLDTANGSHGARVIEGVSSTVEKPLLSIDDQGVLIGMPSTLIGSSGSSGGGIYNKGTAAFLARGGPGGKSGAGLAILSKGMAFNESATIDLSGETGLVGDIYRTDAWGGEGYLEKDVAYGGAGAGGCPGGLLLIVLDSTTFHAPTESSIHQIHGVSEQAGSLVSWLEVQTLNNLLHRSSKEGWIGINRFDTYSSNEGGGAQLLEAENVYASFSEVVFLDTNSTVEEDTPDYVETEPTFTLIKYSNTPVTPDGDRSTIEVSVTPPSGANNYSHSLVDIREAGTQVFSSAPPASHESIIEVPSDGKTYDIRIRPVSTKQLATDSGPIQQITVADINGRTDVELAVIYPFYDVWDLEISGQSGTVFSGLDAAFRWDGSNSEHAYFDHYQVEIWSGATFLRLEESVSPFYVYSYSKNITDHVRINGARTAGTVGAYLSILIKVKPVSKFYNNISALYAGAVAQFSCTASTVETPDNLRFTQMSRDDLEAVVAAAENGGATAEQIQAIEDAFNAGATTEQIQEIADAATTADWSSITGDDKPADNADVTDYTDDRVRGNKFENDVTLIPNPIGATHYTEANSVAGAIIIILPQGFNSSMVRMTVDVFQYSSNKSFSLTVGGYLYNNLGGRWYNSFVKIAGDTSSDNRVRLGKTPSGKACIVIGETGGAWSYPTINVKDFQAGFRNHSIGNWDDGWSIILSTSLSGYTFEGSEADFSDNLLDANRIVGQGDLAKASAVEWASQINNMPPRLTDNATQGLNITETHLGYYNGAAWSSYMDDLGRFYLQGNATNFLYWDGFTLQIKGDIEATSIKGNAITGVTVTGGIVRTSDSNEKVQLDEGSNSLQGIWDDGGGVRENVRVGRGSSSEGHPAIKVGVDGAYNGTGIRVGVNSKSRNALYAQQDAEADATYSAVGISCVAQKGNALSGNSTYGAAVTGLSSSGLAFNADDGGYGNFKGVQICLIKKTNVNLVGSQSGMRGRAVKIINTLYTVGDSYLFEIELNQTYASYENLGIIKKVMTFQPYHSHTILRHFFTASIIASWVPATYDICMVYTSGIVPARVNGISSGAFVGASCVVSANTNGELRLLNDTGIHTVGKSLQVPTGAAGSGSIIPVRLI